MEQTGLAKVKSVVIFEGPDGAGKTTAAKKYAQETGARYVHLGSFPGVTTGLARMFYEAMLPALMGYQDVVMDRCWLSEPIYGTAYRGGKSRIMNEQTRMLERVAHRCGAVVVYCLPPMDVCVTNFSKRREQEMLDNADQLRHVHSLYVEYGYQTSLPYMFYDYTNRTHTVGHIVDCLQMQTTPHPISVMSAGYWDAPNVVIADSIEQHWNDDLMYQLPFVSFNAEGIQSKIAYNMRRYGIKEDRVLWIDANQSLSFMHDIIEHKDNVIITDQSARKQLEELGITNQHFKSIIYTQLNSVVGCLI